MKKLLNKFSNLKILMSLSLFMILFFYIIFLGKYHTINLILDEYIMILIVLILAIIYYKIYSKIKNYELIDFTNSNNISLKNTILFFLFFEVIDFYYEDGFIGMISLWFSYWIIALTGILAINTINLYKNMKLIESSR